MVETFWQDSQNCISFVQSSMFPEEFSLWASLISCKIRSWCKVFFDSCAETFQQPNKNSHLRVQRNILKRKNFFLTQIFFFLWGLWPRYFWNFRQNNFVSFVDNCIQLIQRIDLMKILSFKNLELLYQFRTLNKKSPDFLLENFCTVVETVLACPGYIWGKKVENIVPFFSFLNFDWLIFTFVEVFLAALSKLHSLVPADQTEGHIVYEKFYQALTSFGLQCRSFRILGGNFLQFRQLCILCVQRNILDYKVFIETKVFESVFGLWAKTIRTFGALILGIIFRTAVTCP